MRECGTGKEPLAAAPRAIRIYVSVESSAVRHTVYLSIGDWSLPVRGFESREAADERAKLLVLLLETEKS